MKGFLVTVTLFFCSKVFSQVAYTWNGGTSSAWNVSTNWTPNGVPVNVDNVTIVTGANNCILNAASSINNFTISSGVLNLGGFVLTSTGDQLYTSGTITNGTFVVNGSLTKTTVFTSPTFNASASLNVTTGAITINGGVYNGVVNLNQTGAVQTSGSGGAVFNSTLTINNSGTNHFRMQGGNTYNGFTSFTNSGSGYFLPELNTGSVYNSTLSLTNSSSSNNLRMCYSGTTTLNGNVVVNNLDAQSIVFCELNSAAANLTTGKTISVGAGGFAQGTLDLRRFTQLGTTAQSLSLTGAAYINLQANCEFNGSLTVASPRFGLSSCVYNGAVIFTKTGLITDATSGGNTFNSSLTVNHNGGGYWSFANGNADVYNGDVFLNNNSSERIIFGHNSTGNLFNGNIYVSQIGSSQGIALTWNGTSTATLAATKSIFIGVAGFNTGYLYTRGLTQLGSAPINLTLTGSSSIYFGPSSVFGGSMTITSPDIYATGATYQGAVVFNKNGGSSNHNSGNQNIFNSTLQINNSSTGYFMVGYNSNDLFNGDITLSSTNTGGISIGWSGGSGTPTLASGKAIYIGSAGYSDGYLQLGSFTQLGNVPMNLNLTGNASFYIRNTPNPCTIGGALTVTSPDIYIQGGVFNGATVFNKTGGTNNNNSSNQNIFNSTLVINQQSNSGYFMLGSNSNDLFNGDITVTDVGSSGIHLGGTNGIGAPVLAAGKSIFVGGAGFSNGYLDLNNFTQAGNAPINLVFTGTSTYLRFANNSNIGGSITATVPSVYYNGALFNGSVAIEKNGSSNDYCAGSNTFQAVSSFTNSGTGYLLFAGNNPDVFNGDVYFTNSGSSYMYPAYNSAGNLFNGNISVNSLGSSVGIYFSATNNGSSTLAAAKTISVGTFGFNAGYLILRQFTQLGNVAVNLNLGNASSYLRIGPSTTIGGNFSSSSPGLFFESSIFGSSVNSNKTGTTNDYSPGGNTFNGVTSFTASGSGLFGMGNGTPDVFNSDVKFSSTGSSVIQAAYNSAGNLFNGNIEVNSTNTSTGIYFCSGGIATCTLLATKTISVGTLGFTSGYLILQRFTQLGSAAVTLNLGTTSNYLRIGPQSTIGGNLVCNSPGLFFDATTFAGSVSATKNGSSNDASPGGNLFNGVTSFTNSGSGNLVLANNNPDVFNADVYFTNTGSNIIYPAHNSAGNLFNGNITVNSTGSSTGIYFSGTANGSSTLAAAKTISIGALGFTSGYLILRQFTQLGNAAVNLNLGTTSNYLRFGPLSTIGGSLNSTSPGLLFNGCTFNGLVNSEKNGTSNDASSGTNIFNAVASFTNSGSGYLMFGNGNNDVFNAASRFNNLGSSHVYVSNNSTGNVFNGSVTLNNSPTSTNSWIYFASAQANNSIINGNLILTNNNGAGIYFGNGSGATTLTAGNAISIGVGGFNDGQLIFRNFTQAGSTAQSFTTTGTSILQYGPSSLFGGNVTSQSPRVYFNTTTFNGIVTCEKNGSGSDASGGNNIFNAAANFTNSGSGYLMFGNGNSDVFNASSKFNNLGSSHIYVSYNSTGNVFNGPVTLNNTPASTGSWIYFANAQANNCLINGNITITNVNGGGVYFGNGTGSATLSSGYSVLIGASGFNSGQLIFRDFHQQGTTAQYMILSGTSDLLFGPNSSFDGNVTSVSPALYFNGCEFSGTVNSTKNGPSNNQSTGNNIFNAATSIFNTNSGYLRMAVSGADVYKSSVLFSQTSTGNLNPNYNTNCTYLGNVTVESPLAAIVFGPGGNGVATFSGSSNQTINKIAGSIEPTFTRFEINKSSNHVTLNTAINISSQLTLSNGLINTTSANFLNMNNNTSTSIGNALSYINGPMKYDMAVNGSRTLNFPIGKAIDWRPMILTATHNNGTSYTYNSEVFNTSANALGWTYPPTVNLVSLVHYWDIDRTVTSSGVSSPTTNLSGNQTIVLFYGANDGVTDPNKLTICKNTFTASTTWIDIGRSGATVVSGSISSTSAPNSFNSFSRFTLGNLLTGTNPLPIELLSFKAEKKLNSVNIEWTTATEVNNDYYEVEKSENAIDFNYLAQVKAHGSGNSHLTQKYSIEDLFPIKGISYYRLKQTDKDGSFTYSRIESVNFETDRLSVYPNPFLEKISINGKPHSVFSYRLYNNLAQEILSAENLIGSTDINTSDLVKGTYFLKLTYGSETIHLKMIK